MDNTTGELLGVFVVFGFLVIFAIGLFVPLNFVINDEGSHTGYVTAVQKEGLIIKRYNIFFKTDNSSSQEDSYCVTAKNKKLAETLRLKAEKAEKITIFYYDKFTTGIFNPACGTDEIYKLK